MELGCILDANKHWQPYDGIGPQVSFSHILFNILGVVILQRSTSLYDFNHPSLSNAAQ
jgi:hypothetical protein